MCGRYYIEEDDEELMLYVERARSRKNTGADVRTGEIFPSNIAPVICNNKKMEPSIFPMHWGIQRFDGKGLIINARLETASESRMFSDSFRSRRCLIPASRYFEWKKEGSEKIKHAIKPYGYDRFYMAGLYMHYPGIELPQYVVLTHSPVQEIAHIHNRMPVILTGDDAMRWISDAVIGNDVRMCAEVV